MKNYLTFSIIVLFTVTSCNTKVVQSKTEEVVELPADFNLVYTAGEFLDNWHQAATDADFDTFFNSLSDNAIYIGTDNTEVWSKEEFIGFAKPYFDRGVAWDFSSKERNLYVGENKEYLWFDEVLSTWMGTTRGSGVVHYNADNQEFKIVHYVLSLPIPNDAMNDVIKIIKQREQQ